MGLVGHIPLWLHNRPKPLIDWSFLGSLPSSLIFARASTGVYVNAAGTLASAASGAPRFAYDPVTLAPKGLLLEGQSTNTVRPSVPDVSWQALRAVNYYNQTTSPDGTNNASLITDSSENNSHYTKCNYDTSFTAGTIYVISVYAKAGSATAFQISFSSSSHTSGTAYANFDLSAGIVGTVGSAATAYIEQASNGWYRCSVSAAATSTASAPALFILTNSNPSSGYFPAYAGSGTGVYLYGAQLEASDAPSSYIPTTTASATRAKDYLYTTSIPWLNATEGAFCIEVTPIYSETPYPPLFRVRKSTDAENTRMQLYYSRTTKSAGYNVRNSGVNQADYTTVNATINYRNTTKSAFRYKEDNFMGAVDGALYGTDSSGIVPSGLNELYIPHSLTTGGMYLKKLAYWNRAISNAELQRITS